MTAKFGTRNKSYLLEQISEHKLWKTFNFQLFNYGCSTVLGVAQTVYNHHSAFARAECHQRTLIKRGHRTLDELNFVRASTCHIFHPQAPTIDAQATIIGHTARMKESPVSSKENC